MESDQTATAAFLRSEEVASRLADELVRLDEESRKYSGAATALGTAGDQLIALASAVRTTGERTAEVVTAIREVGSPAIIDGLDRVGQSVKASNAAVDRAMVALGALEQLGAQHAHALEETHATFARALGDLRSASAASAAEMCRVVDASTTTLQSGTRAEAESVRASVAQLLTFVSGSNEDVVNRVEAIRGEVRESRAAQAKQIRVVLILSACATVLAGASVVMSLLR